MKYLYILFAFFMLGNFSLAAEGGFPHQLTMDEKLADLSQLIHQIKNGYGPKEYKKEKLGIDVDTLAKKYWREMEKTKNNGEFYSLIIKFVAEFKDGHFNASIPTGYKAFLPVDVNLIKDKVLIENVQREILSVETFPFEKGDEVIALNGRPVEEIMNEFIPYVQTANPLAAKAVAAYWITFRPGRKVPVPLGDATLTVRSRKTGKEETVKLAWQYIGELFDENIVSATKAMTAFFETVPQSSNAYDPTSLSMKDIVGDMRPNLESTYHCNPITRINIPKNAVILIEKPFTAYYYPTSGGNIGYIRIPDYSPPDDNKDGKEDYGEWFENYRWTLNKLEKNTMGLVIDQDHNCGGDIYYLENIVSLFIKGEFEPMQFKFRASKEQLLWLKSWMEEYNNPYYMEYDGVLEIYGIIKDSIEKGLYLTPMTTAHGNQKITGLNVYTKPVVILIDYFAGSGGDAFPAIMQGMGRAKLLGTTTAGLGGHVAETAPLTYSQIKIRLTQSLFFKPDGTPVENIGAIPDIPYEITADDFVNGYEGYKEFYTKEILKLVRD